MDQEVKCQEEKSDNDKSSFENVDKIHCFGNTDSNVEDMDTFNKTMDTEVTNIKKNVEVNKDRRVNLDSYFENTNKIYIFENTDSHFQDGNGRFVDMINIKQEVIEQDQMSESENTKFLQDDSEIRTERSDLSFTPGSNNLEFGNLENSDIDFENRHVKTEYSDLTIESGPIINVNPNVGDMLTHSNVVPNVDTMLSPSEADRQLANVDTMLSPSEAHPHVLSLLTQSALGQAEFKCHWCDKKLANESQLKGHRCVQYKNEPFHCDICDKSFVFQSRLKIHKLKHLQSFKCNFCDKKFKQESLLTDHKMSHMTEWPHQCHLCDKGFKQVGFLTRHLIRHNEIKAIKRLHNCSMCDKEFKSPYDLNRHQTKTKHYSSDQSHRCNVCFKGFQTLCLLRKHKITHIDETPYQCNICEKAFKSAGLLTRHGTRHSIHQCTLCAKGFTTARLLRRHMTSLSHSPVNPLLTSLAT